jgi:hypothetical protein
MLVLRPSEVKKLTGDFAVKEGVAIDRADEVEDVAMIVDAREGPLRGVAANAGYGRGGGALGWLLSPVGRAERSVAEYASALLGNVTPESVDD